MFCPQRDELAFLSLYLLYIIVWVWVASQQSLCTVYKKTCRYLLAVSPGNRSVECWAQMMSDDRYCWCFTRQAGQSSVHFGVWRNWDRLGWRLFQYSHLYYLQLGLLAKDDWVGCTSDMFFQNRACASSIKHFLIWQRFSGTITSCCIRDSTRSKITLTIGIISLEGSSDQPVPHLSIGWSPIGSFPLNLPLRSTAMVRIEARIVWASFHCTCMSGIPTPNCHGVISNYH